MKLERLISIIYKLLNHDVITASALAEEFQVSPRTIYRDIDAICAAGFPVISHQGYKGGFGMIEGYKMDKSLLGKYDVDALITVLKGLSTVFEDERVQGTIDRLQTIEPERRRPSLEVDFETRRADPEALRLLRAGIAGRNVVRFEYVNAKNERTTREIEPIRLQFKFGNWYIHGYCRSREEHREFRLSRMMEVSLKQEIFQPRPETAADDEASNESWREQVEDVVFRVRPEALAEALDLFQQVDKQFLPDGSLLVRIPMYQPLNAGWLTSLLLGFGSGAEVLEPPALRNHLRRRLQDALKLYEEV
ncbi:YafY family transcriptional regulator [Paenibacillus sp. TRM 82003]|nr:YafY family transcriptional regulator [Paenibacillus sp. TRM 82003]